ncbi:hypothetical protein GCM10027187_40360 [Streptosporangium sandarakinum]|uniref:Uncharacterized protein n=1 Tax=Streptosporangium sandarakinum TaxID=1260955 RepID=A0A852VBM3_9ACTN|nr:hypothetical protein [Streptosporangium sandarakinum]NYF44633.1 hypothetical protein [Streptosporangium sandarakinum]
MSIYATIKGGITITPPIPLADIDPASHHLPANRPAWASLPIANLAFHLDETNGVADRLVPAVAFGYKIGHPAGELEEIIAAHGAGRTFAGELEIIEEEGDRATIGVVDDHVVEEFSDDW